MTKALGAPEFVADLVSKFGPGLKNFLPAVVFLIAAFLGFATGTSWGTFTILLPIVIPVFSGGIPAADQLRYLPMLRLILKTSVRLPTFHFHIT